MACRTASASGSVARSFTKTQRKRRLAQASKVRLEAERSAVHHGHRLEQADGVLDAGVFDADARFHRRAASRPLRYTSNRGSRGGEAEREAEGSSLMLPVIVTGRCSAFRAWRRSVRHDHTPRPRSATVAAAMLKTTSRGSPPGPKLASSAPIHATSATRGSMPAAVPGSSADRRTPADAATTLPRAKGTCGGNRARVTASTDLPPRASIIADAIARPAAVRSIDDRNLVPTARLANRHPIADPAITARIAAAVPNTGPKMNPAANADPVRRRDRQAARDRTHHHERRPPRAARGPHRLGHVPHRFEQSHRSDPRQHHRQRPDRGNAQLRATAWSASALAWTASASSLRRYVSRSPPSTVSPRDRGGRRFP